MTVIRTLRCDHWTRQSTWQQPTNPNSQTLAQCYSSIYVLSSTNLHLSCFSISVTCLLCCPSPSRGNVLYRDLRIAGHCLRLRRQASLSRTDIVTIAPVRPFTLNFTEGKPYPVDADQFYPITDHSTQASSLRSIFIWALCIDFCVYCLRGLLLSL